MGERTEERVQRSWRLALSWALLASLGLPPSVAARTWRVTVDGSGDAPTIQAAVDSCEDGDEILVGPGDYTASGQIFSHARSLSLRSELGPEVTTVANLLLSGGHRTDPTETQPRTVVDRDGLYLKEMSVTGFRLTASPMGPPIFATTFNRLVIDHCVVEDQPEHSLFGDLDTLLISDCVFARNTSTSDGIPDGGGALMIQAIRGRGEIRGCRFIENRSIVRGGAIMLFGDPLHPVQELLIHHCVFDGNEAPDGGAVWVELSNVSFQHNTFVGNRSRDGALVIAWSIGSPEKSITSNNIFYRNSQFGLVTYIGAVSRCYCNDYWQNDLGPAEAWCDSHGYPDFYYDPFFCLQAPHDYRLSPDSPLAPWNTELIPCGGEMGALGVGCSPLPAVRSSWGRLRTMFGTEGKRR